jgi:beta-galactosidase
VPLYDEVAQLGNEFAKASPVLAETSVKSEVAILHSYDSRWAINWQRHNGEYDPVGCILDYYRPLRKIAQSVDIVAPTALLNQYKLVVAPCLNVVNDEIAKNLIEYVKAGGHLVLGQRSAMKDDDNGLQPQRQPGPLVDLLGGRVEQYYALTEPVAVEGSWGVGKSRLWAELLSTKAPDAQVLMRWGKSNGWLDGQPAAITRKVGNGRITYIGAWLDGDAMKKAAEWMASDGGVKPAFGVLPEGVDVYPRYGEKGPVYILVNFTTTEQTVKLPATMDDVLEGGKKATVKLPQYGVAVLKK